MTDQSDNLWCRILEDAMHGSPMTPEQILEARRKRESLEAYRRLLLWARRQPIGSLWAPLKRRNNTLE
jgi:hypothetical protein